MTNIIFGNLTHQGNRDDNQDSYGKYSTSYGELFIVCDGMGGRKGGATASGLAVDCIKDTFFSSPNLTPTEIIIKAILRANEFIYESSLKDSELNGMGTTAVILLIDKLNVYVANIGDSRIYEIKNAKIIRLTKDHSFVQTLVDDGYITPEEAKHHPDKNMITSFIGQNGEIKYDILGPLPKIEGTTYLLCSDGLHDLVEDAEILDIVSQHDPQKACSELVQLALKRGGYDNITVQVVNILRG